MSDIHLRRDPQHVRGNKTWWYYEEAKGISIVVEADLKITTRVVEIPWQRIRSALKRLERKP